MSRPVRPDPNLTARVRALVERTSISEVGRLLHLADATVARLAGGLNVSEGTEAIAIQRLAKLRGQAA